MVNRVRSSVELRVGRTGVKSLSRVCTIHVKTRTRAARTHARMEAHAHGLATAPTTASRIAATAFLVGVARHARPMWTSVRLHHARTAALATTRSTAIAVRVTQAGKIPIATRMWMNARATGAMVRAKTVARAQTPMITLKSIRARINVNVARHILLVLTAKATTKFAIRTPVNMVAPAAKVPTLPIPAAARQAGKVRSAKEMLMNVRKIRAQMSTQTIARTPKEITNASVNLAGQAYIRAMFKAIPVRVRPASTMERVVPTHLARRSSPALVDPVAAREVPCVIWTALATEIQQIATMAPAMTAPATGPTFIRRGAPVSFAYANMAGLETTATLALIHVQSTMGAALATGQRVIRMAPTALSALVRATAAVLVTIPARRRTLVPRATSSTTMILNVNAAQGSRGGSAIHALSMILVPTAPTHVLNTAISLGIAGASTFTAIAPTACVDLGLSVAWME